MELKRYSLISDPTSARSSEIARATASWSAALIGKPATAKAGAGRATGQSALIRLPPSWGESATAYAYV